MTMTFKTIIETLPHHIQEKLNELKNMRERPDFHPEPSAFHHIEIVTNRCIEFGDKNLICTGIFHDIHKLDAMHINKKTGWPTSPGHAKWAQKTVENDESVRQWIKDFGADPDTVASLCGEHMRIHQFSLMKDTKKKRLFDKPFFNILSAFSIFDDMLICDTKAKVKAKEVLKITNDFEAMKNHGKHGEKDRK